jgi:hypothetical protein
LDAIARGRTVCPKKPTSLSKCLARDCQCCFAENQFTSGHQDKMSLLPLAIIEPTNSSHTRELFSAFRTCRTSCFALNLLPFFPIFVVVLVLSGNGRNCQDLSACPGEEKRPLIFIECARQSTKQTPRACQHGPAVAPAAPRTSVRSLLLFLLSSCL